MDWFISYMDEEGIDAIEYFGSSINMNDRLQKLKSSGLPIWDYGKE